MRDNTRSGVSSSKRFIDLTDSEKGTYCDWQVNLSGGYGKAIKCDDAGRAQTVDSDATPASREACVKNLVDRLSSSCALTVGQQEDCNIALKNAVSSCGGKVERVPECDPYSTCLSSQDTTSDGGAGG